MGDALYSSMAFITGSGTDMYATSPSWPCPLPWTVRIPRSMSQSRMACISMRRSPMYAPRHRTTLCSGSAAAYATLKSSSSMNTLSLDSLLWRISVLRTTSTPVWNSTMPDRLRR